MKDRQLDDDVEMFTECDIHALKHPLNEMCQLCRDEKMSAEYAKAYARLVTDGLISTIREIGGGR